MFCTKCGNQLEDGLNFCTACGAKVPVKEASINNAIEDPAHVETTAAEKPKVSENESAEDAVADEPNVIETATEEPVAVEAVEDFAAQMEDSAASVEGSVVLAEGSTLVSDDSEDLSQIETTVMQPIYAPDLTDVATILPESALEPSTEAPAFAHVQADEYRYVATQPTAAFVSPYVSEGAYPTAGARSSANDRRSHKTAIAISSVAAVAVIGAIGVMFSLGVFKQDTPIDAKSFPNDIIRGAVIEQLDLDGDGLLSDEEAKEVTALVYTPKGAKFVTGGKEVDVSQIRDEIAKEHEGSQAGATSIDPDANVDSDIGQSAYSGSVDSHGGEAKSNGSVTNIEAIEVFSNIKTLVATDSNLTSIDLGKWPLLEYVDLRGNPDLKGFDLASNPNIKVLFCDEDTNITGLDEAGLYYTDLITGMSFSRSYLKNIEVEYDTHARPIKVNGYKFSYDENGRPVKEEQTDVDQGAWYAEYTYGSNGLPSTASSFTPLDPSQVTYEYAYGYDGQGQLTQFASGQGKNKSGKSSAASYDNAGEFSYSDGKVVSYKSQKYSVVFEMNSSNMLEQSVSEDDSSQVSVSCSYDDAGAMTSYYKEDASIDGALSHSSYKTDYSASGAPIKTTSKSGDTVTYNCNSDGYITQIDWGNGEYYMSGVTGKISYVKRVGSLSDRESERFVPVIRPCIFEDWVIGNSALFECENWFYTTGDTPPVTVMVMDPRKVVERQMGLLSNMLCNQNELTLAAYDREHWTEGLNLSGDQSIESDGVSKLLEKASKKVYPATAQTILDDEAYGPVIQQYFDVIKAARTSTINDTSKYDDVIPGRALDQIFISQIGFEGEGNNIDVLDVSLFDMNSDGVNELAVTLPHKNYFGGPGGEDDDDIGVLGVYAQKDGEAHLIAGGGDKLYCWVTTDGNVITHIGGFDGTVISVYSWDGNNVVEDCGIGYDVADDGKWKLTTTSSNGSMKTETLSSSALDSKMKKFWAPYKHARLNWTPIPVS